MGHLETLLKNANEKRNVDLAYVQTLGQYLAELKLAEDMILAMGPNKDDFVDLVLDMNASGTKDSGEPPVQGVMVVLEDGSGNAPLARDRLAP